MNFKRENFYGLIFHWYAVDSNGFIAKFISGFGSIPKDVFNDKVLYERVDNYFENLIADKEYILSPLAKQIQEKSLMIETLLNSKRRDNDLAWDESMKGLYIYDERDYGPEYDLLSSPEFPVKLSQQSSEIQEFLSNFMLSEIEFEVNKSINPLNYFDCD